jgi:hypothetical protein
LHVVWLSWALNIPWLVVELSSDSKSLLMEVPDLSVSSIWSLEHNVSVVDDIKVSIWFHLWDNIEWSLDIETEFLVKLTFDWLALPLISIDDIPLLVNGVWLLVVNTDVSVLLIDITLNLQNFAFLVNDCRVLIFEQLPPSAVCGGASDVGWASIWLDVKWVRFPKVTLDGLWDVIEVPLLSHSILSPSSEIYVVGSYALS